MTNTNESILRNIDRFINGNRKVFCLFFGYFNQDDLFSMMKYKRNHRLNNLRVLQHRFYLKNNYLFDISDTRAPENRYN